MASYHSKTILSAVGNDQFYYEDVDVAAGQMVKLVASQGEIDTSQAVTIFPAYQNVCVVNGENLKIADFANVKLTHAALTNPHGPGTILKQGDATNFAKMIVLYTNRAKTNTYGLVEYGGSVTKFTNGSTLTATGDLAGSSTTLTADGVDPPHWYDWEPYPDVYDNIAQATKSYGTMPEKAFIGCLYLGRAVLSGNPNAPFQWYMSRAGDIFDWLYLANDDLSPILGGQGNVGYPGDVIRMLAPYKDDYLVIGCATSIYVIFGDPVTNGQLRELSLTTGVFGNDARCWDDDGNFYFWGANGIYKTSIPGNPKCISHMRLPNLVNDENASPATHKITMGYDNIRNGILVTITHYGDNVNSNYWLPLETNDETGAPGIFPEEYPEECGVHSMLFYDALTTDHKGLLLGGADGYIRKFDESKKNDDIGASEEAIESFVGIGPIQLSDVPNAKGTLSGLDLTLAGGGTGSTQADSDDVTMNLYTGRTAENIIEQMDNATTPRFSRVMSGPGQRKGSTIRQEISGVYTGIYLQNSTPGKTWAFERLTGFISPSGRIK
jgi:hypothetical protein